MSDSNNLNFSHPNGSPKRWRVLNSILLAYFYDSYDLVILSISLSSIIGVLNISYAQGGLLSSASMLGAAIGSIIFGVLAENKGKKFTLVLCLVWFGIGTGGILLISTWLQWIVLRFITCLAIGGIFGPSVVLIRIHWADKFHIRLTSLMVSVFSISAIIASLLGQIILKYDWRLFFLIGTTSIIVAIVCQVCIPSDIKKEDGEVIEKPPKMSVAMLFRGDLRKITICALVLNAFMMAGYWGFGSWVPTFIVNERGVETSQMTNYSLLIYIGMFFGYQLGAFFASKIGKKKVIFISLPVTAVAMILYLFITNGTFLLYFGPFVGCLFGAMFGVLSAFFAELYPNDIKALGSGFCFNVGRIGSVVAPYTIGVIADSYGLRAGLIVIPVVCAISAVILIFLPESYESRKINTV